MRRYEAPRSQGIKDYYETLRITTGKTSKSIAKALGITAVSMTALSYKLDQMTADRLNLLAKELGVEPSLFIKNILELRKNTVNELDA